MLELIEMHAIVSGRVQGVGFRWTTHSFARELGLKGTVRNLNNGTVEIIAQGERDKLDKLVSQLKKTFALESTSFEIAYTPPKKTLSYFTIS